MNKVIQLAKQYAEKEAHLIETVRAEFESDYENGDGNPLGSLMISFNGLAPMPFKKFMSEYPKIDVDAQILISELMAEFKADAATKDLQGIGGNEDFAKWLVAKYGGNRIKDDILMLNKGPVKDEYGFESGEDKYTTMVDEEEAKQLENNWRNLGFAK